MNAGVSAACSVWTFALLMAASGISGVVCGCAPRQSTLDAYAAPKEGRLLPARVRRLSNIELQRSVHDLLGLETSLAERLPPDVRQEGYTPNAEQSMPATTAVRWASLADELAAEAVQQGLERFVGCDGAACRDAFISRVGRRAWRRPLVPGEASALSELFELGKADGGLRQGVELTLSALLQSPNFLYLSELGRGTAAPSSVRKLGPYEISAHLAYTLSGAPPDEELLALAEAGELDAPEVRREQAWRILGRSSTRHHFRRFALEWLEVDELDSTAKDSEAHPRYEQLKPHMLEETRAFVDEVMVHHGASVGALLASGFASVDPSMARYYGLDAFGPAVPLRGTDRVGVLQHASFLSAHSLPNRTSPVLRGDFILRRVLCRKMPRPAELGIEVVMPAPKPGTSTRELFVQHTADPECRSCHQVIDPLGYALEGFDAAGKARNEDSGRPVNTHAELPLQGERLTFDGAAQLSIWLANNPKTSDCFARQAFRYFSAQHDPEVEAAFVQVVRELPADKRGSLIEILVAYAASDLFVYRDADEYRSEAR